LRPNGNKISRHQRHDLAIRVHCDIIGSDVRISGFGPREIADPSADCGLQNELPMLNASHSSGARKGF
jgi:hypothetical protein